MRDSMILESVGLSRKAFDMEYMITAIVMSGMLKAASTLERVLRSAVMLITREQHLRDHLLSLLGTGQSGRAPPSRCTIIRHRLTVHMGWRSWEQAVNDRVLQAAG
eukprot:12709500-Alexandrium_andersonii.AAC.1